MDAENDQFYFRENLLQATGNIYFFTDRQGEVGYDEIGNDFFCCLKKRTFIGNHEDLVKLGLKQGSHACKHTLMPVGKKHSFLFHFMVPPSQKDYQCISQNQKGLSSAMFGFIAAHLLIRLQMQQKKDKK